MALCCTGNVTGAFQCHYNIYFCIESFLYETWYNNARASFVYTLCYAHIEKQLQYSSTVYNIK